MASYAIYLARFSPPPPPPRPLLSHGAPLLPSPMASLSFASAHSLFPSPLVLRTHPHLPLHPRPPQTTAFFATRRYDVKPHKGSAKRFWSPRGKKGAKRKKGRLRISKMPVSRNNSDNVIGALPFLKS